MNRLVMVALLCATTLSVVKTYAQETIQNTLYPFTTNGCSYSPDGTKEDPAKWQHCCVEHDYKYWIGGTQDDRKAADVELRSCISEAQSDGMGLLYYIGIRVAGRPPFHWGYGWQYSRGYEPLSSEQLDLVESLTPPNLSKVPITEVPDVLKPYPSPNGNYCIDEIAVYMKNKGKKVERVTGIDEVKDTITFQVEGCKKSYTARFQAQRQILCTEARYTDKPSDYLVLVREPESCN